MTSKKFVLEMLLPCFCLLFVGYLVGTLFETLWLRLVVGYSAGITAFFLFRRWGMWIVGKGEDEE